MTKTLILSLAAATGLILGSLVQAANPGSTRTLTSGIGSGTTSGRIPSSNPYTSRSRGYSSSGHSRSSYADGSLTKFANGTSHRPAGSYHPDSSASSYDRPSSIPAGIPAQAAGHVPSSIGGSAMAGSAGISGGVSSPPPLSIPATIPDQAAGHVPAAIGGTGISNPPPASIPADIPAAAAGHVPGSIGGKP